MSLRLFHIIFVSFAILLMIYIGSWSYLMWDFYADSAYLSYIAFSIVGSVLLIIYGKNFINKYKNL